MADMQDLITQMSRLSYFSDFSRDNMIKIIQAGVIKEYSADTAIIREGMPCAGLFVLIHGEVYLKKIGPEGQYHTLYVLTPVSMFNEVSVFDQGENPASAITGKDSLIWRIDQNKFLKIIKENPSLAIKLLSMMTKRIRYLLSQYENISFLTVQDRLIKLLLELSGQGDHIIIREKHTTSELSERIGTVPEVLCRAIKSLKEQGVIEVSRSEIKICNVKALTEMALCN